MNASFFSRRDFFAWQVSLSIMAAVPEYYTSRAIFAHMIPCGACHLGVEGKTPVPMTLCLVQKVAEGKGSYDMYELSWGVRVLVSNKMQKIAPSEFPSGGPCRVCRGCCLSNLGQGCCLGAGRWLVLQFVWVLPLIHEGFVGEMGCANGET